MRKRTRIRRMKFFYQDLSFLLLRLEIYASYALNILLCILCANYIQNLKAEWLNQLSSPPLSLAGMIIHNRNPVGREDA